MAARTLGAGFFGAFVGAWLARALFKWILDFDGTLLIMLIVATAAVGATVCVAGELGEGERR
jgi:uncharacterized membrane protein YeaQ/YmgE (transglycosylase-associated protein family)